MDAIVGQLSAMPLSAADAQFLKAYQDMKSQGELRELYHANEAALDAAAGRPRHGRTAAAQHTLARANAICRLGPKTRVSTRVVMLHRQGRPARVQREQAIL